MIRISLICLLTLSCFTGLHAQLSLDEIDMGRIKQKKIRSYLSIQQENIDLVSDFKPSCINGQYYNGFTQMENTYLIKQNPNRVWDVYKNTNITESWTGRRVSFGVLFSKWSNFVCYRNGDDVAMVDTGQVFFINLRFLRGVFNLPVGVEIIGVDEDSRTICFSYLDGGKSSGIQVIQVFETPEGNSKVVHTSEFKSDSEFRDKYLYPHYHTKVLNEYHRNMAKRLVDTRGDFRIN